MFIAAIILTLVAWTISLLLECLGSAEPLPVITWAYVFLALDLIAVIAASVCFAMSVGIGWMIIALAVDILVIWAIWSHGALGLPFWVIEIVILVIGVKLI